MVPVAVLQRRHGEGLGNQALIRQAKQAWLARYRSLGLLMGLGLNALSGWRWADPVAALLVAGTAPYTAFATWRATDGAGN